MLEGHIKRTRVINDTEAYTFVSFSTFSFMKKRGQEKKMALAHKRSAKVSIIIKSNVHVACLGLDSCTDLKYSVAAGKLIYDNKFVCSKMFECNMQSMAWLMSPFVCFNYGERQSTDLVHLRL